MADITGNFGVARFHYRVAGVWLRDGHVLLQGDAREDFWALPGGRVAIMERAEDALRREMREELALAATGIGRLLWIVQNFFDDPLRGGAQHEFGLYFLLEPPPDEAKRFADLAREYSCAEPDSTLSFRWFPLDTLAGVIRPSFLARALCHLPAEPALISHDGR